MLESAKVVPSWRLTDHVCRVCFGRVLERKGDDGSTIVRCANCGVEAHGQPKAICCCGVKTKKGRLAGLRCMRNPEPTPEQPAELIVAFGSE